VTADLRRQLADATHPAQLADHYMDALTHVVERYARAAAAKELRRVIDEVASDPRMQIYAAMLRNRADALEGNPHVGME
jgi:hypothetical protein